MKIVVLILSICFNAAITYCSINCNDLKEKSEIKITHFAHEGISSILIDVCNEIKAMKKVEYVIKCNKNIVKIEETFTTINNEIIDKCKNAQLTEYLKLWKDLNKIGIMKLNILPQEIKTDPHKYYDSLHLDKDTYAMYFSISKKNVFFEIYDIESYRDKRFLIALKKVLSFVNNEN